MSNVKKIVIFTTLLLFMLFINVGYASLTRSMNIGGTLQAIKQPVKSELYISNVTLEQDSNVTVSSYKYYDPTILQTSYDNLKNQCVVVYKVTITNDSNKTYWYDSIKYLKDDLSNIYIDNGITIVTKDKKEDGNATFNKNDYVPSKTSRDFYVVFTFGSNVLNKGNIATSINFHFVEKIDAVYDAFEAILNNPETYATLSSTMDSKYKTTGEKVIGNIGNDCWMFDTFFGSNMTITVDGKEVPVTVLIRRENVDGKSTGDSYNVNGGPTGCEYTLYITTGDLSTAGSQVTTYAITYSKGSDGVWHRLAQLYEGTTKVEDYSTTDSVYQGSVDVYSWQATAKTYEIADGLSYKLGQKNGDQYEIMKDFDKIISVQDQNIFNSIDNTQIFKKVYDLLMKNIGSNAPEVERLREAFENAAPFYVIHNGGQEIKVKRDGTRAEIISYLVDIQEALDYYYQFH